MIVVFTIIVYTSTENIYVQNRIITYRTVTEAWVMPRVSTFFLLIKVQGAAFEIGLNG